VTTDCSCEEQPCPLGPTPPPVIRLKDGTELEMIVTASFDFRSVIMSNPKKED
jgi:hypothetical protein